MPRSGNVGGVREGNIFDTNKYYLIKLASYPRKCVNIFFVIL